jgi:hypothetical protein
MKRKLKQMTKALKKAETPEQVFAQDVSEIESLRAELQTLFASAMQTSASGMLTLSRVNDISATISKLTRKTSDMIAKASTSTPVGVSAETLLRLRTLEGFEKRYAAAMKEKELALDKAREAENTIRGLKGDISDRDEEIERLEVNAKAISEARKFKRLSAHLIKTFVIDEDDGDFDLDDY